MSACCTPLEQKRQGLGPGGFCRETGLASWHAFSRNTASGLPAQSPSIPEWLQAGLEEDFRWHVDLKEGPIGAGTLAE